MEKNTEVKLLGMKEAMEALGKLHLDLEPVRDKALDEKARLTGYSQCVEQIIKIILARISEINKQVEELESSPKQIVSAAKKTKAKK